MTLVRLSQRNPAWDDGGGQEAKPPPEYRSSMDLVQCRVRQSFDYVTHLMDRDNRARVPPSLNGVAALANGEAAESVARSTRRVPCR